MGQGLEALQQALRMLVEAVQGLTTRVGEVLAYATSDEMTQHMTKPDDPKSEPLRKP